MNKHDAWMLFSKKLFERGTFSKSQHILLLLRLESSFYNISVETFVIYISFSLLWKYIFLKKGSRLKKQRP